MNDRFESGKVKRSMGVTGEFPSGRFGRRGLSRCIARRSAANFFLQEIFRADRTEDFGGRETAYDYALNV